MADHAMSGCAKRRITALRFLAEPKETRMLTWYNRMRLMPRLLTAILGLVFLVGSIMGAMGYFNLSSLAGIVGEITEQRLPAVRNATAVERYALRALSDERQYRLALGDPKADRSALQRSVEEDVRIILSTLDDLDRLATARGDSDLLDKSRDLRQAAEEYKGLFAQVVAKVDANTAAEKTMDEKGQIVVNRALDFFRSKSQELSAEARQAQSIVVDLLATALDTRVREKSYIASRNPSEFGALDSNILKLGDLYEQLRWVSTSLADADSIDASQVATSQYYQAAQAWAENDRELRQSILPKMQDAGIKMQERAVAVQESGWQAAEGSRAVAAGVIDQAVWVTGGSIGVAALVGLLVSVLIAGGIARSVQRIAISAKEIADVDLPGVARAARAVADGDLTQTLAISSKPIQADGGDEISDMARSFNAMIEGLQQTGSALDGMVSNLRLVVDSIAAKSLQLNDASRLLSSTSNQAGSATQQIAATIQQVAKGNQEQSVAVQETMIAVGELSSAIDEITRGAQEQARAIQQASASVARLNASISQVAAASKEVTAATDLARSAAESGANSVEQSVRGMGSIRQSTAAVAAKIQDLGSYSTEIGAIVETIDDIAGQTNLLALNAAIEAARAGEHGRGFAVVADEVRKLAERSSRSAKEIADLISRVQQGTQEAISAMDQGYRKVEDGVRLAEEAGVALRDILNAVQLASSQVSRIASAVQQMEVASHEVVAVMDSVSTIVERSLEAGKGMSSASQQVERAIEKVAAVSEETSAASEEVSASTEEMTAQVQEMVAQAQQLAGMADELRSIVGRFQTGDGGTETGDVVMRRRSTDWDRREQARTARESPA